MNIDLKFNVIANCAVYSREENDNSKDELVSLTFDENSAKKFLLRFYDPSLDINGYKLMFKYNGSKIEGIILYKDELIYIVKNPNEMINEIYENFLNASALMKINDVLSFDFDAANILKNEIDD
jgi:hypothetical protein